MDFTVEAKEYDSFSDRMGVIINDLKELIVDSNDTLEGNCFYYNCSLTLCKEQYTKQVNLFAFGKGAETRICEIGFNAGHSTILILLGREKTALNYTIFDIDHHAYTRPCFEYVERQFQNVNF
jgi:tRNA(Leu) C34 or U34 (ribose-2'-O)-methylase TrmL